MKNLNKAFTLIELLVVIAIIALLSAVVIASLTSARDKGNDSAIKSNLNNIATQSMLINFSTTFNGGVAGACSSATAGTVFADSIVSSQILAAAKAAGGTSMSTANCVSDGTNWAVSVALRGGGLWCVDSNGARRQVTEAGTDKGFSVISCK